MLRRTNGARPRCGGTLEQMEENKCAFLVSETINTPACLILLSS